MAYIAFMAYISKTRQQCH